MLNIIRANFAVIMKAFLPEKESKRLSDIAIDEDRQAFFGSKAQWLECRPHWRDSTKKNFHLYIQGDMSGASAAHLVSRGYGTGHFYEKKALDSDQDKNESGEFHQAKKNSRTCAFGFRSKTNHQINFSVFYRMDNDKWLAQINFNAEDAEIDQRVLVMSSEPYVMYAPQLLSPTSENIDPQTIIQQELSDDPTMQTIISALFLPDGSVHKNSTVIDLFTPKNKNELPTDEEFKTVLDNIAKDIHEILNNNSVLIYLAHSSISITFSQAAKLLDNSSQLYQNLQTLMVNTETSVKEQMELLLMLDKQGIELKDNLQVLEVLSNNLIQQVSPKVLQEIVKQEGALYRSLRQLNKNDISVNNPVVALLFKLVEFGLLPEEPELIQRYQQDPLLKAMAEKKLLDKLSMDNLKECLNPESILYKKLAVVISSPQAEQKMSVLLLFNQYNITDEFNEEKDKYLLEILSYLSNKEFFKEKVRANLHKLVEFNNRVAGKEWFIKSFDKKLYAEAYLTAARLPQDSDKLIEYFDKLQADKTITLRSTSKIELCLMAFNAALTINKDEPCESLLKQVQELFIQLKTVDSPQRLVDRLLSFKRQGYANAELLALIQDNQTLALANQLASNEISFSPEQFKQNLQTFFAFMIKLEQTIITEEEIDSHHADSSLVKSKQDVQQNFQADKEEFLRQAFYDPETKLLSLANQNDQPGQNFRALLKDLFQLKISSEEKLDLVRIAYKAVTNPTKKQELSKNLPKNLHEFAGRLTRKFALLEKFPELAVSLVDNNLMLNLTPAQVEKCLDSTSPLHQKLVKASKSPHAKLIMELVRYGDQHGLDFLIDEQMDENKLAYFVRLFASGTVNHFFEKILFSKDEITIIRLKEPAEFYEQIENKTWFKESPLKHMYFEAFVLAARQPQDLKKLIDYFDRLFADKNNKLDDQTKLKLCLLAFQGTTLQNDSARNHCNQLIIRTTALFKAINANENAKLLAEQILTLQRQGKKATEIMEIYSRVIPIKVDATIYETPLETDKRKSQTPFPNLMKFLFETKEQLADYQPQVSQKFEKEMEDYIDETLQSDLKTLEFANDPNDQGHDFRLCLKEIFRLSLDYSQKKELAQVAKEAIQSVGDLICVRTDTPAPLKETYSIFYTKLLLLRRFRELNLSDDVINFLFDNKIENKKFFYAVSRIEHKCEKIREHLESEHADKKLALVVSEEKNYRREMYKMLFTYLQPTEVTHKPSIEKKEVVQKPSFEKKLKAIDNKYIKALNSDRKPELRMMMKIITNIVTITLTAGIANLYHLSRTGDFLFYGSTRSAEKMKRLHKQLKEDLEQQSPENNSPKPR